MSNYKMEVAPNFCVEDWEQLKLDGMDHSDWKTAVDKFWQRINTRYLEPVSQLLVAHKSEKQRFGKENTERIRPGFIIMMIDFSLIEDVQKFKEGIIREMEGKWVDGMWKTNDGYSSRDFFTRFLENCTLNIEDCGLMKSLGSKDIENIYKYYRNPLAHSASTGSRFTVKDDGPLLKKYIEQTRWYYEINRELFHNTIKAKIDEYCTALRNPSEMVLRKYFVRKFNEICETPDAHKRLLSA